MSSGAAQRTIGDVEVGEQLAPISIPITLQRLVIEAGANRDFSLIHHDRDVARKTGAPDAYMNTFFIAALFERLVRGWMGLGGQLNAIRHLRMQVFNVVGDVVTVRGAVRDVSTGDHRVVINLACETDNGVTVTAEATVTLPV